MVAIPPRSVGSSHVSSTAKGLSGTAIKLFGGEGAEKRMYRVTSIKSLLVFVWGSYIATMFVWDS